VVLMFWSTIGDESGLATTGGKAFSVAPDLRVPCLKMIAFVEVASADETLHPGSDLFFKPRAPSRCWPAGRDPHRLLTQLTFSCQPAALGEFPLTGAFHWHRQSSVAERYIVQPLQHSSR
jgi:hypothetical protein